MFNGNISQLDRNHSLSLFYSRRTPSKNKPIKQSKFTLPTGEYLSPAKINTPYNSATTPVLVHSLSDMSLKNEDTEDCIRPDDSPTPASRYSKIKNLKNNNNNNSIENTIPLYPPQKLKTKSNSASKVEGTQGFLTLSKFQRKSRMSSLMLERKPVNLFSNFTKDDNDLLNETSTSNKIEESFIEKNEMNLDEQNNELDGCPYSEGFLNEDGIWEDPTLSQSESRCLQTTTIGNIMTNNENNTILKNQIENNNDKTLLWEFEDDNKFNDKENIIPDDYRGGVIAEREWCESTIDEDSVMEEYDNTNEEYLGTSSKGKSAYQKGKKSVNSMIKKSEHHERYAFQEISINSMPEYQMDTFDCFSVYSNSSFGSNTCEFQMMGTPKKCTNLKMNNSYSKSDYNNSFNNMNDNLDIDDTTPSFFNTLPLIKNLKANASSSSAKKNSSNKKLVYQLCGIPDLNAVHKKSITKSKVSNSSEKKNMEGELSLNNSSYMNSSPIISKSSILSPPFLLTSPIVRNGFSSPLVQSTNINNIYPYENKSATTSNDNTYEHFKKQDTNTMNSLNDKTPKPRKVKSLLTTSINNSLSSSSEGEESKILNTNNMNSKSSTVLKDTTCNFERDEDEKITPRPRQIHGASTEENTTTVEKSSQNTENTENTVFFPHYHPCQNGQEENGHEQAKECDESLIDQTSNMMSISPKTLSKINQSHNNFLQLNDTSTFDIAIQESPQIMNMPKRNRISINRSNEMSSKRKSRIRKFGF